MRKLSFVVTSLLVLTCGIFAKVTLAHMNEGMTMVFRVQSPAMLKQVKVGDKVRFDADRVNGQLTVTKIEKAR